MRYVIETRKVLIKTPMNYMGGKFKLLPQIIPLFPSQVNTFVDLFGGGGDISLNIMANTVIYNELDCNLVNFMKWIKETDTKIVTKSIEAIIGEYNLSKCNKDEYLKLRYDFNNGKKTPAHFYSLLTHSFSNQVEYNKKGEFNTPSGYGKSWFNPNLLERLIKSSNRLKEINIEFSNKSFIDVDLSQLKEGDFVYIDPPYLISGRTPYSKYWNMKEEIALLSIADSLNERNIKFAISNVLEHKKRKNEILYKYSERYNIHDLSFDYKNSNYQSVDKGLTREVLVTNY